MNATQLRRILQVNSGKLLSEWTREDLARVMKRTRQERGGLSLIEIAEVIRESLQPEEVEQIKKNL